MRKGGEQGQICSPQDSIGELAERKDVLMLVFCINVGQHVGLLSSDGYLLNASWSVAVESQLICRVVEDCGADSKVPLPRVSTKILSWVVEFCEQRAMRVLSPTEEDGHNDAEVPTKWELEFMDIDNSAFLELVQAAEYLSLIHI